jgi:hypothetical protein
MSWDVVVLNYGDSPPADVEEMGDAGEPDPLGSAAAVRKLISDHLDGVDWSDPTYGVYRGDGFTIEFPIRDNDPVDSLMLHVRGGGDPIAALLLFAQPNNWTLFDCSTSQIIAPDDPSQEGWEGFQKLRDTDVKGDA